MKKITVFILCAAMISGLLYGCAAAPAEQLETVPVTSAPTVETAATEATEIPVAVTNDFRIALIAADRIDPVWIRLEEGALKAAEELGCEVVNMSPMMHDAAQQIEQIEDAAESGCDAIVIAVNDPETVAPALEEAAAAGVKIVCVDTPLESVAEAVFAMDNKAAGKAAGETMFAELEAREVEEGSIAVVNISPDAEFAAERELGFREAFEGSAYTLLDTFYSEGDAAKSQHIAQDCIKQGVVGIFGCDEGSLNGSGNAVKASDAETIVVGFGSSDVIERLIEEGNIVATMVPNPDVMGYEGVKAACAALNGLDLGEGIMDTGVSILRK